MEHSCRKDGSATAFEGQQGIANTTQYYEMTLRLPTLWQIAVAKVLLHPAAFADCGDRVGCCLVPSTLLALEGQGVPC